MLDVGFVFLKFILLELRNYGFFSVIVIVFLGWFLGLLFVKANFRNRGLLGLILRAF